jgi:ABC-type uncharacterized transport system permease subunit
VTDGPNPNVGQVVLLTGAVALFAAGGGISLSRLWADHHWSRLAAKACMWLGVVVSAGVLVWHSLERRSWLPLEDNFDTFVWLGVMLALFVMYVQRRKPIGGLEWFVMPIVILLLIGAAVFGSARPHEYVRDAWSWVHRLGAFGGAAAFAVAAAAGAMYLVANKRLREKSLHTAAAAAPPPSLSPGEPPRFASLERLEHVTQVAVTLGFALLTIGAVTGIVWMIFEHKETSPAKVALTAVAWLVYGLALHSPITPSFRGRKTAMLSIAGFALMIAVLITVQWMPTNG